MARSVACRRIEEERLVRPLELKLEPICVC